MDKFCEKCGAELIDGVCPKCVKSENVQASKLETKFKGFFMSPQEKLVTILGNSYLESFFHNGSVTKGFVVASDKRVYFQGKKYYINEVGDIEETHNSRIVDLRDVIGTGFDSFADKSWIFHGIIMGIIFFFICCAIFANEAWEKGPLIIAGFFLLATLYCFFQYQRSKLSLIIIQYAGGNIGYKLKWFQKQEIELFQKQLRLAKDKVVEKEDNQIISEVQAKISIADELSKLADLLEKGVITQEEFEKMKKELI